jgi:hypothetical protein
MKVEELLQAFCGSSKIYTILEIIYQGQNFQSLRWWIRVPEPSFWFLKLYNPIWLQLWPPFSSFWFILQFEFFLLCVFLIHLHALASDPFLIVCFVQVACCNGTIEASYKFSIQTFFLLVKVSWILAWQACQPLVFLHLHSQLSLNLPILVRMNF